MGSSHTCSPALHCIFFGSRLLFEVKISGMPKKDAVPIGAKNKGQDSFPPKNRSSDDLEQKENYRSSKHSRIISQPFLISSSEIVSGGEILRYSFL